MARSFGFIVPNKTSVETQLAGLRLVNALLRLRFAVKWATKPFSARTDVFNSGHLYSQGDFLIPPNPELSEGDRTFIEALSENVTIHELIEVCDPPSFLLRAPRIALYKGPGTWDYYLWYSECLRTMGFVHDCLSPSEISSGELDDYDVYIQPGGDETSQAAALWPDGREEVRKFLENGGNYLGSCAGLDIAGGANGTTYGSPNSGKIKFFNLVTYDCVRNVSRDAYPHDEWAKRYWYHLDFNEYSQIVPVSFRTPVPVRIRDSSSPIVYGYEGLLTPGIRYSAGPIAKELKPPMRAIADFASDLLPLNSSWEMPAEKALDLFDGAAAISVSTYGKGGVVLFSPHPEDPGNPEYFRMVANAIFYLTAADPARSHEMKDSIKDSINSATLKSSQSTEVQDINSVFAEIKKILSSMTNTWETITVLSKWKYPHVPELLLRIPGQSLIMMPDFHMKTLTTRIDDLSRLLVRLKEKSDRVSSMEAVSPTVDAQNMLQEVFTSMRGQLRTVHDAIAGMAKQTESLRKLVDNVVELRRRIDLLQEDAANSNEAQIGHAWTELDEKQSELNDRIWGEIIFCLDGKPETSFFARWKPNATRDYSKGILAELARLYFQGIHALELSECALAVSAAKQSKGARWIN